MTLFRSIRLGIAVLGVTVAASALGGAAPTTAEAAGIVPRKPDVAVKAVGHSGGITDSFMTVAFDVTNKYQPADNVQLKSECSYRRWNDTAYRRTEPKPTVLISLLVNQQVPQVVTCSPNHFSDEYVSSASMIAVVPVGDSDPSNNTSSWDAWTGK
jgi:hypothetical protein